MSYTFTIPVRASKAEPRDQTVLGGLDISLSGGDFDTTSHGDWATVSGRDAANQSVVRETMANPGSLPRRPKWGRGIPALLFKSATRAVRDRAVSQTLAGLKANRRITSVGSVTSRPAENGQGMTIMIQAETTDGPISPTIVVKGRR